MFDIRCKKGKKRFLIPGTSDFGRCRKHAPKPAKAVKSPRKTPKGTQCKSGYYMKESTGRCNKVTLKVGADCTSKAGKDGKIHKTNKGNKFCKVKQRKGKVEGCTTKGGRQGLKRTTTKRCVAKGKEFKELFKEAKFQK